MPLVVKGVRMLLRRNAGLTVAISQPAHAWLAGRLAAAWGNDLYEVPSPRHEVICATSLHDIGWLEWERAPALDQSTGFPLEFQNVPAEIHTKLWQRGIDHAALYGSLPALFISRHGDAIYDRTFDMKTARPEAARAVTAFRAAQNVFQKETIRRLTNDPFFVSSVTDINLAFAKAFIVAVDTISLNLCWGSPSDVEILDVPLSNDRSGTMTIGIDTNGTIAIDPWPFQRAQVQISIEGKRLDSPSRDQTELDRRFATAASVRIPFIISQR